MRNNVKNKRHIVCNWNIVILKRISQYFKPLTLSCIMLQNGQTYFKNFAVWTPFYKNMHEKLNIKSSSLAQIAEIFFDRFHLLMEPLFNLFEIIKVILSQLFLVCFLLTTEHRNINSVARIQWQKWNKSVKIGVISITFLSLQLTLSIDFLSNIWVFVAIAEIFYYIQLFMVIYLWNHGMSFLAVLHVLFSFLSAIWNPNSQLWAIVEETSSLIRC